MPRRRFAAPLWPHSNALDDPSDHEWTSYALASIGDGVFPANVSTEALGQAFLSFAFLRDGLVYAASPDAADSRSSSVSFARSASGAAISGAAAGTAASGATTDATIPTTAAGAPTSDAATGTTAHTPAGLPAPTAPATAVGVGSALGTTATHTGGLGPLPAGAATATSAADAGTATATPVSQPTVVPLSAAELARAAELGIACAHASEGDHSPVDLNNSDIPPSPTITEIRHALSAGEAPNIDTSSPVTGTYGSVTAPCMMRTARWPTRITPSP